MTRGPRPATRGRREPPAYRPATLEDLPVCTRVWRAGLADYLGRLNADDGLPVELEPLRRLLAHLLATDPERFWVATRGSPGGLDSPQGVQGSGYQRYEAQVAVGSGGSLGRGLTSGTQDQGADRADGGERVVGFASAVVRGGTWFLSMLFVDPAEQAAGVGRSLLEHARTGSDGLVLGTATDSAQVISNAMYARAGIVPRLPCLQLTGRPDPAAPLPELPIGVTGARFEMVAGDGDEDAPGGRALAEAVGAIDLAVVGYERPRDHAWLRGDGRIGWLYRDGTGRPVGYGYGTPVGRIGPVAALEPGLLVPIVGHLLGAIRPAGASSLWVPGAAAPLITALLETGFRLEPFPALLCWSAPLADFERYLPISLALV